MRSNQKKYLYRHNLLLYNLLATEERKQFKHNVETHSTVYSSLDNYLELHSIAAFSNFISSAFDWSATQEGHAYWRTIANRDVSADAITVVDSNHLIKDRQLKELEEENQRLKLIVERLSTVKTAQQKEVFEPSWAKIFHEVQHYYKYKLPVEVTEDIFNYLEDYYVPPNRQPSINEANQTT
jgi:hypothetical protein